MYANKSYPCRIFFFSFNCFNYLIVVYLTQNIQLKYFANLIFFRYTRICHIGEM